MNEETNENNINNLDGKNNNDQTVIDLENAFSDLISEYFGEAEGTNANNNCTNNVETNCGEIEQNGEGTTNSILYNNLETIQQGNAYNEEVNVETTIGGEGDTTENTTNIYNKLGDITPETSTKNIYEVITFNESVNNLVNENNNETGNVVELGSVNTNTDFKLTQGNLPAKIGFWTKLRNFFIPETKLQYSIKDGENTDTGIWTKVQNFFSFGKEK